MAENEWLNGYLEAILDVGSGRSSAAAASREDEDDKSKAGNKRSNTTSSRKKFYENTLKFDKFGFEKDSSSSSKEEKLFSPTKYFVEEVVNCFDESALHRTWIKC